MKLYAAGNFVLMSSEQKEKQFVEEVRKRGELNRLISFYFKKELETIIKVRKSDEHN